MSYQRNRFSHSFNLLILNIFLLLFINSSVSASVELLQTLQSNKQNKFIENISAIQFRPDGSFAAVDSRLGVLIYMDINGQHQEISLTGRDKIFKSNTLSGVYRLPNNHFAIANASDSKIAIINAAGELQVIFGERGSRAGMLDEPQEIAYSLNGRLYVADRDASRISVFNSHGIFLFSIGDNHPNKEKRLNKPTHVAVDAAEHIYILEAGSSAVISVYDHSGELLQHYTRDQLQLIFGGKTKLSAMDVDLSGRLFLADSNSGKILQLDWRKGQQVSSFGSYGSGPGQYKEISALTISEDNKIAVADSDNNKLDIYQLSTDDAEEVQRAWLSNVGQATFLPLSCTAAFRLHNENILCLDSRKETISMLAPDGKLLSAFKGKIKDPIQASYDGESIAILTRNKVMVFNYQGDLKTEFGSSGSDDGELDGAQDLHIANGKIFVAEADNKRIQIFSMKGVHLGKLPSNGDKKNPLLPKPVSVVVDPNDNIYVADAVKKRILVFSGKKEFLYELGEPSTSPNSYSEINDLALDSDNNLYVLGATQLNEQTIQVYSGSERIFQFGSFSKIGTTAIADGTSISIAPSVKTLVSVFDNNSKNTGLLSYDYLQIPGKVTGIYISGGVHKTSFKWRKPAGNYVDRFIVYAANEKTGDYTEVLSTRDVHGSVDHLNQAAHLFFKVAAVSGFGSIGSPSEAVSNEFQLAYELYQKKEYDKCISILQDSLLNNPEQAESVKYLGLSYQAKKQYDQAAQQFGLLSSFPDHNLEGLNLQVEALYDNKEYAEAMALIKKTIAGSQSNIDSYINCGKLSLKISDPIGAVECLEAGQKLSPANTSIQFLLSQAYINIGAVDKGLAGLAQAVASDETDATVWSQSGDIYQQLKKYDIAKEKYQKALNLDKENTQAQLGLAQTLLKLKELNEAKAIAINLAGKSDTSATGNYLLGVIALNTNNAGEAVLALNKATRGDAGNIDAWLALADAYQRLKKSDEAKTTLINASKADENSFEAFYQLGIYLSSLNDDTAAADAFARATILNPNHYHAQYMAAKSLHQVRKYSSAADHASKAMELAKNDDPEPLLLMGNISQMRGKTSVAIEHIKKAIALKPNDASIHTSLGKLYLDNNVYDQAQISLDKAIIINPSFDLAHQFLGSLYLSRQLFDKAIKSIEKAVELNASPENTLLLDTAIASKKKSLDFTHNAPQLVLEDLRLDTVFSAAYKQYSGKPVGAIKVKNIGATDFGNLKVSFNIKGYMDFPTTHQIKKLAANANEEVPLISAFNNKVLEIDEDTGVQVEVKLSFTREGREEDIALTRAMTIYGKNAIVWKNPNMIGSFVTPKDNPLRDFVRQVINEYRPARGPLNDHMVTAMSLFDSLSAYGIKYVTDPNNPFANLSADQIDYVQFARETLKLKSGDCDDLSVLLSAGLENLGIETALLDIPGHLLLMFNTTTPAENKSLISGEDELLVIHEGTVWIPIEATMLATNFMEAWAEGARKYQENKAKNSLEVIPLKQAWSEYQPVTLSQTSFIAEIPSKEKVLPLLDRERQLLLEKSLARLIMPYNAMLKLEPQNTVAKMQIAIIYARYGLAAKAITVLDEILDTDPNNSAVFNNRGNIYFEAGEIQQALDAYSQAEKLDANDGGIKLNMALAHYKAGEIGTAKEKFIAATRLNQTIGQEYSAFGKLLNN